MSLRETQDRLRAVTVERDDLRARVAELEGAIRRAVGPFGIPRSVGIVGYLHNLEDALKGSAPSVSITPVEYVDREELAARYPRASEELTEGDEQKDLKRWKRSLEENNPQEPRAGQAGQNSARERNRLRGEAGQPGVSEVGAGVDVPSEAPAPANLPCPSEATTLDIEIKWRAWIQDAIVRVNRDRRAGLSTSAIDELEALLAKAIPNAPRSNEARKCPIAGATDPPQPCRFDEGHKGACSFTLDAHEAMTKAQAKILDTYGETFAKLAEGPRTDKARFGPKCPAGDECENRVFLEEYERVDAQLRESIYQHGVMTENLHRLQDALGLRDGKHTADSVARIAIERLVLAPRSETAVLQGEQTDNPSDEPVQCRVMNIDGKIAEIRIGGARLSLPYEDWDRASRFVALVERLVNRSEVVPPVKPHEYKRGDRVLYNGRPGVIEDAMRAQPARVHIVFQDFSTVSVPTDTLNLSPLTGSTET